MSKVSFCSIPFRSVSLLLTFCHRSIIYRDLKPENVGFDVAGTLKLFDFGLCKEIIEEKGFEMTGLTGSRCYMAPEVVLCQEYGLNADVYSFAILFWEVAALAEPFKNYSPDRHFKNVVLKGKRPTSLSVAWMSSNMVTLLKECWKTESNQRPPFSQIIDRLRGELATLRNRTTIDKQSLKLMERSWHSRIVVKGSSSLLDTRC